MNRILIGLLIILIFVINCQRQKLPDSRPPAPMEREITTMADYRLSINDVLEIKVKDHPDLSHLSVPIRPDGKIDMYLIGEIVAEGKTLTQLDEEITNRLKEYIRNPDVTIYITKFAGEKVFVFGEVVRSGIYTIIGKTSLIEALAQAGGWTRSAKICNVFVVRGDPDNPEIIQTNVEKILQGDNRYNIVLYPKDIVYVPSTVISDIAHFSRDIISSLYTTALTGIALDYFRKK